MLRLHGELDSALLNALPAQVALLNVDGIICAVNEAWIGYWGSLGSPGSTFSVGANYLDLCGQVTGRSADRAAALTAGLRSVLVGQQETFSLEYSCQSPNGEEFFRIVAKALRTSSFQGAVVTHLDITDQKARQAGRQTDQQAEKMEALGRLTSGVAHDFANLLTLISGYSEIVLNRMSLVDPLRSEMEEIRKASNRGAGMTAQLLDFIRSEVVQPKVMDLNTLVADMEKMLRPIIGEHIELAAHGSPQLGKVKADPAQMARVIMNLVLNARDAMPRGGRIVIQTENLELDEEEALAHEVTSGSYVAISLTDNGQGMDTETLSHMFEPFFTTKGKGKGTGLGLSTVYSIVKQNQGAVWVSSEWGKGTRFTICLPRVEEVLEPAEQSSGNRPSKLGTETILLVEDEDGVRRLMKHILTARGYKVLDAADGLQGFQMYRRNAENIDLVLTDMVMPRMSGGELAQQILDLQPEMKVVFMSGYTDDVLSRTGALRLATTFLQKPLKPEVLAEKIREVLDSPATAHATVPKRGARS